MQDYWMLTAALEHFPVQLGGVNSCRDDLYAFFFLFLFNYSCVLAMQDYPMLTAALEHFPTVGGC